MGKFIARNNSAFPVSDCQPVLRDDGDPGEIERARRVRQTDMKPCVCREHRSSAYLCMTRYLHCRVIEGAPEELPYHMMILIVIP